MIQRIRSHTMMFVSLVAASTSFTAAQQSRVRVSVPPLVVSTHLKVMTDLPPVFQITTEPLTAFDFAFGSAVNRQAPPAWASQDPADSLYREGRRALNRNDYWQAATLFRGIRTRYPRSSYTPDAFYWEAWALYRRGGRENLHSAVDLLDEQSTRFPNAGTRNDAPALSTRALGELARLGDADATSRIRMQAVAATSPPTPSTPPTAGSAPTPPPSPATPRASRQDRGQQDRACREDDDDLRSLAMNSLLQMDDAQAIPLLKTVLARRDAASLCLRRKAVFIVAQHDTEESGRMLLDAVRNDPDSEVRQQAVFWLSQVKGEAAVEALESVLLSSRDPELQDKAIFALSQHQSRRAAQALRTYVENAQQPAELREKAIFWIGQQGSAESMTFLQGLYGRLREPELRQKVLFAVSQSDRTDAGQWLVQIAKNPNESVETRKQALFWAGQRKDTPVPELGALYTSLPDRELKEHLIFMLAQKSSRAAVDKLFEIARTEPDAELRKKAIFWLSQTNDPRVPQLIGEILEKP